MVYVWLLFPLLSTVTSALDIELLECDPPDVPRWGGYAPRQDYYVPGDVVHYYCDTDTHISGNEHRKCEDTGHWSGDTPVCDVPSSFSSANQSSTANAGSSARRAIDGIKTTCTSTVGGRMEEWIGILAKPGELMRVMLFFPIGPVSFEVVLVKSSGKEIVCGSQTLNLERYEWTVQNCLGPNNLGTSGLKIKSLTNAPLQICELQAYVLVSPKCRDPHLHVGNGHIELDRKSAVLKCDKGFKRGPDDGLNCIRDGQWNRKRLYCSELTEWEFDDKLVGSTNPRREHPGDIRPKAYENH